MKNGLKICLSEVFKNKLKMPFDQNSVKIAGEKYKRGIAKKMKDFTYKNILFF